MTFKKKKTNPISAEELAAQVITQGLERFEEIITLGGKGYVEIVEKAFRDREIKNPLAGCRGNGIMMGRLESAIRSGVPLVEAHRGRS